MCKFDIVLQVDIYRINKRRDVQINYTSSINYENLLKKFIKLVFTVMINSG